MGKRKIKSILNFKPDMLYEVQSSTSSFFGLQCPPDVLYLKEYSQIIMTFIINMIRNGKKEDQNVSKISNVTCYVKFRFFISTFFDFKEWKNERSKGIFNFKRDMLCEVQGSISSFFWLQGPPDVLYLKEYSQIIITSMINMMRNGE